MVRNPIEIEQIISAISSDRTSLREELAQIYLALPPPGYALPMAWRCAAGMSNELVDRIPRYSSADHGSIFKSLLTVVHGILKTKDTKFNGPYFDVSLQEDETVKSCLDTEYNQVVLLN